MGSRRRKHWGWGREDEQPSPPEVREAAGGLAAHLGFGSPEPEVAAPPALGAPRVAVPAGLAEICVQDDHARAVHAHGASYVDVVRAFRGRFPHAPDAEAQLAEHGLTLRFYPQSFEFSTLGGWIATRAAGHFASGPTHVDDLVEAVRALTISGEVWESRRLPGSGAGPSPDRVLLGSEGTLAVITEAWVRVRPRPEGRRSAGVAFSSFAAGAEAVREIVQAGLRPANCRLIDAREAALTFAGDGSAALLVLGFEEVVEGADRAWSVCRSHGGRVQEGSGGGGGAWRSAFLRAPYLRDTLVAMGVLSETFETAVTWERLPGLVAAVSAAVVEAVGEGIVTCRLTHAYPDGAAPYFTVLAPAERGDEEAQWGAIKAVAGDAVLAAGGTITHHHAIGRDHRRWYDRQRPQPFADAMHAAKAMLDPDWLLNPGVLWEAR
jgi:alkyldihydroxyacetonephosphate synthase